jgi:hypothetical protein
MRLILAIVAVLGLSTERAEACACCDAQTSRTVIGWSETEVMLDHATNVACSPLRALEVWKIGASKPARCYDLFGTPDAAIDCDLVSMRENPADRPKEPKASKQLSKFARKAVPLSPARLAVAAAWVTDPNGAKLGAKVTVRIATKQVLSERFDQVAQDAKPHVLVEGYAAPNGKRALLVVSYREQGTGNEAVEVRWADLQK